MIQNGHEDGSGHTRLRSERLSDVSDKINSTILGAAAEHWVMCQLLRQNMIAALAPAGVPDADIIVSDRIGSILSAIQVKARRELGSDGGWHMKEKHETIIRDLLFYCLVDFGRSLEQTPRSWIVPSGTVADVLKRSHVAWLKKPGRGGRPHQDTKMRRLLPSYPFEGLPEYQSGWLDKYADESGWELLRRASQKN